MGNLREDIKYFIKSERTNFEFEEGNSDDTKLAYANREHGDMENDECGDEDWEEGMKLQAALVKRFGKEITINLEPCDEWVLLDVTIKNAG